MNLKLELVSVNVARPAPLGTWQGEAIVSAIAKVPVAAQFVAVNEMNIDGDAQADLSVHGGRDKAVYAYPADHWPWWQSEAGFAAGPGSFGENLTVRGADEAAVRIGDQFAWGPVILEVSQPRAPCFKFVMYTKREDLAARMTLSTRTGWYARVLAMGHAPVNGPLMRISTNDTMPSIRDAFMAAYHRRISTDLIEKVIAAPALARGFRAGLLQGLSARI
jgi:MOSC domain-containing protein YiiM